MRGRYEDMVCSQELSAPENQPKPKKPPEPIVELSPGAKCAQGRDAEDRNRNRAAS